MAVIRLDKGINCDYMVVDGDKYTFGYDVARKPGDTWRGYGKELLPTVQEILEKYPKPYVVVAGHNKFTNSKVTEEAVELFRKEYLGGK